LKRRHVLAFFQKVPRCLVGIEACASSHHWSRELQALGHTVRLIPPAYVKHQNAPAYSFDATISRLLAFERIPRLNAWENGIMLDSPDTAARRATAV
jgi:transposase